MSRESWVARWCKFNSNGTTVVPGVYAIGVGEEIQIGKDGDLVKKDDGEESAEEEEEGSSEVSGAPKNLG